MKLIAVDVTGTTNLAIQVGSQCAILPDSSNDRSKFRTVVQNWETIRTRFAKEIVTGTMDIPRCLCAPVVGMEKVICIGINYADHAQEMGGEPPEIPVVFNKFPNCITPPGGQIRLPAISQQVDFEAELVVVIGKDGRHIPRESAMEHVFGYCCGNDISARDWQKGRPGGQWLLGKTFETFAPIGPAIVTADEIPDPHRLGIQSRLNGRTMQASNTDQLIFRVDHLIAHLSQFTTLKVGDLIFTGTPAGVGAGRNPPVFLKPGDELEVEIEGLGILKNRVVADC